MSKIIQIDDYSFVCTDDQLTLLEAIEYENIEMEYQCRQGFCGICKVKLLEGSVKYFEEPIAFIPEGYILPCCCRTKNNITISCDDTPKSLEKHKYKKNNRLSKKQLP